MPTLSPFSTADSASSADSSTAASSLLRRPDPKSCDALTSTSSITVSSRSSTNRLICGSPVRAVTFQSIARTSSPGTYGRTSSNSMPRPLNTDRYAPAMTSDTCRPVTNWMRLTACAISAGSMSGLRDRDVLEDLRDDVVGRLALRLGLVRDQDAVAKHVVRDRLDVVRRDVAAARQEGLRLGDLDQRDRGAHRGDVVDQRRQVGQVGGLGIARGGDQVDRVALDLVVDEYLARHLARGEDLVGRQHLGRARLGARARHAVDDLDLVVARRIADLDLEHEAIELRLGQRIRALLLDRVLGREHEER